ncbi:MAG: hypothetical protein SXA11_17775, partial [Cyanobacteriota bacterium]|nr:hypothetical protein [Cyanobacteriota bacterium]
LFYGFGKKTGNLSKSACSTGLGKKQATYLRVPVLRVWKKTGNLSKSACSTGLGKNRQFCCFTN